jgi:outer membrane receptor protein involved in Fe transport
MAGLPKGGGSLFYSTPYTIANLAANYTVNDGVSTFGRIDNLSDVHYQDPVGFRRPSAFMAECVSPFSRDGIAVNGLSSDR